MIINQAWSKNAKKNAKYPSTPNNGGQKIVVVLSITTEHQGVSRTGRNSRMLSRTLRDPFSTTKSKKLQIRVAVHGS